jgi:acetyl esterase/lipase
MTNRVNSPFIDTFQVAADYRYISRLATATGALLISAHLAAADTKVDISTGAVYVQRDSGPLKADIYVPKGDGPFPGMLVVHGGAWSMGTREQLAGAALFLAEHGYTAVAIDYRLAPQDKWPAQIYDCAAAVRWMREHALQYKIDPKKIGAFGYSAGGHLVAMLGVLGEGEMREPGLPADAASARVQVVLAGGAPCDFRLMPSDSDRLAFWLGGTPGEKPDAYRDASPASYVTADDPPMFFFHGDSDELVQIRSPQKLVERLKELGIEADFYTVKGAGHIPAALDQTAREKALAFADHVLKGTPYESAASITATAAGTKAEEVPANASGPAETSHAQ